MSRFQAIVASLFLLAISTSAHAQVWIGRPNGHESMIDSMGSSGVGVGTPNATALTLYSMNPDAEKLQAVNVAGYNLDRACVKPDSSEVIGRTVEVGKQGKWIVYNFERMEKESKITILAPPPGYEIYDVRYVDDHVTVLSRKDANTYRCDQFNDDGTTHATFETANGDLSGLKGFPHVVLGKDAMTLAAKLPFVDVLRANPKDHYDWDEFFGAGGSSQLGGFDPDTGIVAVRSQGDDPSVLQVARCDTNGLLPTISLPKDESIQQIAVSGDTTFVASSQKVYAYDRDGNLIFSVYGTLVANF